METTMPDDYLTADPAAWITDLADYRALLLENEESTELTDEEAWPRDERLGLAEAKLLAQGGSDACP